MQQGRLPSPLTAPRCWRGLLLLALLATLTTACAAPGPDIAWRATGAPGDLQIRALSVSPFDAQTLYAGLHAYGFHRSRDGGATWQVYNEGLSLGPDSTDSRPRNVRTLYASQLDPDLLFLGSEGGVFRSADGGESWQLQLPAIGDPYFLDFFQVDVLAGAAIGGAEIVFAGTKAGLFTFSAADTAWQPTQLLGETYQTHAILIDPGNLWEIVVGTKAEGIFRSPDGGQSWQQIGQNFADAGMAVFKLARDNEGRLLAGILGNGVYAQADGEWQPMNAGLPDAARIWTLFPDPATGVLFASVGDGLTYRWAGDSWQPLDIPYAFYSLLKVPESGVYLAGTRGFGAYISTDGGNVWHPYKIHPAGQTTAVPVRSLLTLDAASPGREKLRMAGTDSNGVYTQAADNDLWVAGAGFPVEHRRISALARGGADVNGARIYAATIGGGVYRSQDTGRTWTQLPVAGLDDESLKVLALGVIPGAPEDTLYTGTRTGLFRYEPAAGAWQPVAGLMEQMPTSVLIQAIATDAQKRVYAAVSNFGIFRSTDGESWQSVTPNLLEDPIFVSGLVNSTKSGLGRWLHGDDRLFAVNYDSIHSSDTIFDPARIAAWDRRIAGVFGAVAVDAFHPQVIYTGAISPTVNDPISPTYPVLISLDNGSSWRDGGILPHPIYALAADPTQPGILYAGTDSGVYVGEVTLPILWREIGVWGLLYSPLLLLAGFLAFVYLTLTLPYGIPLPTAVRLLLFRRNALALALVEPSPLSSLQQLILAAGEGLARWPAQQMAALLDKENANASSAQLAAALDQLARQFGLLVVDSEGRYRSAIPGLGRIFQRRVEANAALLAKDVREENAIFQDSRDFFRQAGFAVHARRDLLLLTPLQASWAELTEQNDDAPLLARILAGGPPTVADLDESVRLAAAEYNNDPRGRLLFLVVSAAPDAAARRHMRRIQRDAGLALVLISHAAIYQALGDGATPATLQTALRRHRGEISPAQISGPVLDPLDFFDRSELLAQVREKLAAGESLLLSGPPQIGKSSLVWQAARQLDNYLLSYAEFSAGPAWEEQMLGDLLDGLVRDGSRKFARTEWPFDPATVRSTVHSMADFAGTVQAMGEAITLAAARPRLALLVDGLDETTLGWWPQLLAACQQQTDQQIGLVGVVASGFVLPSTQKSIAVGYFTPAAALEMAGAMADQAGVGLDADAAQALVEASGGHPFLLRRLFGAAQLEAETQARLTGNGAESSETRIDGESVAAGIHRHVASNPIYGRWWAALSPPEQAAVLAAAAGETNDDLSATAPRLVALGWLQAEGSRYRLAAGALHVWLEWMGLL